MRHKGIGVFDSALNFLREEGKEKGIPLFYTNPSYANYFKDFTLSSIPINEEHEDGRWLLSHGEDRGIRWSHHSFLYSDQVILNERPELYLFFETVFDRTEGGESNPILKAFDNTFSGSRIDTCVYFLISE